MKSILFSVGLLLCASQVHAANYSGASDGISATVGLFSISMLSTLESTNYYSQQATDDAASFVATDGAVSGPALEKVVLEHRQAYPQSTLSDMDIANSMLVGSLDYQK